jgi:hypothetical protein
MKDPGEKEIYYFLISGDDKHERTVAYIKMY